MPPQSSDIPFPWLLQFVYWSSMSVSANLGINNWLNFFNIWNTVFFVVIQLALKNTHQCPDQTNPWLVVKYELKTTSSTSWKIVTFEEEREYFYIKNRHCNNPTYPESLWSSLFYLWMFAKQTGRHAKPNHSGNPATITHFDSSAHFGAL